MAEHGPSEKLPMIELGEHPPPKRLIVRTHIVTTPDPEKRPFTTQARPVDSVYVLTETAREGPSAVEGAREYECRNCGWRGDKPFRAGLDKRACPCCKLAALTFTASSSPDREG